MGDVYSHYVPSNDYWEDLDAGNVTLVPNDLSEVQQLIETINIDSNIGRENLSDAERELVTRESWFGSLNDIDTHRQLQYCLLNSKGIKI